MRVRRSALGLSIAVHAQVAIVLAIIASRDRPVEHATSTTIELVDAPPPPPAPSTVVASLGGGSHTGENERLAPRVAARSHETRVARGEANLDDGDPREANVDDGDPREANVDDGDPREANVDDGDPRGELRFDFEARDGAIGEDGGAVGDGNGRGGGSGDGRGRGIGLGDGARVANDEVALATPPAPVASKARIARLVYPVREREVDASELFVARVTIDDEGFVVGARLVHGFGGPRDAMAADLIWKFRYAPALDDEGHPIRSTFDQSFLVGR